MRRSIVVGLIAALCLSLFQFRTGKAAPADGFLGRFDIEPLAAEGLSAVWVSADGDRFIAISDRSFAISGRLTRDSTGRISGAALTGREELAVQGKAGRQPIDSEGLAIGPKGEIFVSAEGPARVLQFASFAQAGVPIGKPRDFGKLPTNGALEALAIGPDGTLFAVPETTRRDTGPFPLYANTDSAWRVVAQIPRIDDFLPVAADFGPDGQLYVLFRDFSFVGGFATRLVRYKIKDQNLGQGQTLIETPFGLHGNLEGLSLWRNSKGLLTATMISDDNGNFFQSAELVEYHLPD